MQTSELGDFETLDPDVPNVRPISRVKPTGDGLSKREARKLLVKEMNSIKQQRNMAEYVVHQHKLNMWANGKGNRPRDPIFRHMFSNKQHQQAAFMARQIGGYSALLANAGY